MLSSIFLFICCISLASSFTLPPPTFLRSSTSLSASLTLPVGIDANTRLTCPLDASSAETLGTEINELIGRFKLIKSNAADGKPPSKQEPLEYTATVDGVTLKFECNPNIFPDPFKAEVFITIKSPTIEIASPALLPKLIESVKAFKAANPV